MLVTRPGRLWQIVLRQERLLRVRDRETAMAFGQDGTVLLEKLGDPAQ